MTTAAATREVRLDLEDKRYVIPAGDDGWACWGFQNCFDEVTQLCQKLNRPVPLPSALGTMELYRYHRALIDLVAKNKIDLGTWFHLRTPQEVRNILEAARIDGMKVRIYYGHTEPDHEQLGLAWLEEHDVSGRIGRSMGMLKVPLMIEAGQDGGCALLDHCIVKIIGTGACVTLYEHPKFHLPKLEMVRSDMEGYGSMILADGKVHARFKKVAQAQRWLDFMNGERIAP